MENRVIRMANGEYKSPYFGGDDPKKPPLDWIYMKIRCLSYDIFHVNLHDLNMKCLSVTSIDKAKIVWPVKSANTATYAAHGHFQSIIISSSSKNLEIKSRQKNLKLKNGQNKLKQC